MKRLFVYMVIEVGLALLTIIGYVVGPLLLWPRWSLSPYANVGLIGGGFVAVSLLAVVGVYTSITLKLDSDPRISVRHLRFVVPLLVLALGLFYFLPALTLPAADPASEPLLLFGPTEEVQMLAWSMFTVFIYVPVTLATLFWHIFTVILVKAYRRKNPALAASLETAPQRQTVEG